MVTLFNKTNVNYNRNNLLATLSIRPTPGHRNEMHELRLPDEWGKKWFNLMLEDVRMYGIAGAFPRFF